MPKKTVLDRVEVAAPCSQDWNTMFGNDEVRFCHHCAKNVYNFSEMTRKQAKKLVAQSKGHLCIQYLRRPDGRIQTVEPKLYKIAARASRFATGVFGATLSLSTLAAAQTTDSVPAPEISVQRIHQAGYFDPIDKDKNEPQTPDASRTISDTVTDPNAAVTPDAMGGAMLMVSYENPLVVAASEGDLETVKNLLRGGADVNSQEPGGGVTALHEAVENGSVEIVRELLERGAKPNARTASRRTPLMSLDGDATPELVRLLLTYGARVTSTDEEKAGVLLNAVRNYAEPEILELLIEAGAKVDAADKQGATALLAAAADDNLEAVRILLGAGADPNLKNANQETALSETGSEEVRQLLIVHGAVGEDKNEKAVDSDEAEKPNR